MILSRSDLLMSLEAVKNAVADKPIVPILTHVLFSKKHLLAFDSEIGIRYELPSECPVEFNVEYTPFARLVKALSSEDVDIGVEGKRIQIKCGSHRSSLTQIEETYPRPEVKADVEDWREVPAGFKEGLERALMAVSSDEANRALSSVFVQGDYVYAADGKRGVRCMVKGLNSPAIMLSPKSCKEVIKHGNPKRIAVKGPYVLFDYVNLMVLSRLRDAFVQTSETASGPTTPTPAFPVAMFTKLMEGRDAAQPIPDGFQQALQRLSYFSKGVEVPRVWLDNSGLVFTLKAEDTRDKAEESLEKVVQDFQPKGVNPKLLLDLLPFAETLDFGFDAQVPLYLNGETANFEAIVAPMS